MADHELLGADIVSGDATTLGRITSNDIGMIDAVDVPIIIISLDCRIARVNRAATTALGLSASDIGCPLGNTLAGVENLDRLCTQVIGDGVPYRLETRDRDRTFLLRVAPYTGGDQQILGAVLTFTNVTAFRASIDQAIYEREYTKAILNSVIDPLVVLSAQLQVQTANRAFYDLLGLSRDETQGISIRKLGNHEWEMSEVWKSLESSFSDRTQFPVVEIDCEFRATGRKTVRLDARRLEREGGALVLLTFQDVTERKRAERAALLLAAIVNSSDDAIISKKLDGTITSWNKSAERLFGYTAQEAIGQHILLIVPSDHQEEEAKILEQLRRGQRIDHYETIRQRKDGTKLDVSLTIWPITDAEGHLIGASKMARDITGQKHSNRALSEQARLLDLSSDAIFVRDATDRITYWNKGASELYGYTREEALGHVPHELLCTKFPAPLESIVEQLHRDDRWTGELVHKRKGGTQLIVGSRWVLERDAYGNPRCVLETNTDSTERKLAEQARLESLLSARLLQVQDEERRRIAREMHDGVGQLLAAISMNVSPFVRERSKLSEAMARAAEEISILVARASSEIRTVSYLLHPPMLDEIGLHTALKWYIDGFAERSKIKVAVDLASELPRLSHDYELSLFRIAQECLTNIHRHSGSFTASVRLSQMPGKIELEVRDEGKGIRQEIVAKLNSGSGIGVGFRGMQERVRLIGGKLAIHSDGDGTSVLVSLPINEAALLLDETVTPNSEYRLVKEAKFTTPG